MSDNNWQKVRVAFDDADGNRVEAAMWHLPDSYPNAVYQERSHSDVGVYVSWALNDKRATVTPIRELPTGVGAVIRLGQSYGDVRDFYISDVSGSWWSNSDGDTYSSHELIKRGGYEVLSEGIQLEDVK